jgi:dephospho-CoA kinase
LRIFGLTGGIASGKSTVSRMLRELGASVLDADAFAREVVEPGTPGLARVVGVFGDEVLHPDGSLNREKLGGIVFADSDKLATLNGIVHPLVGERVADLQRQTADDAIMVYDVPLLAENRLAPMYDVVIVVDAADEVRIARLAEHRGMPEHDAKARIAAQATRQDRLAIADIVIDNEGDLDDLETRVAQVWDDLLTRAGRG